MLMHEGPLEKLKIHPMCTVWSFIEGRMELDFQLSIVNDDKLSYHGNVWIVENPHPQIGHIHSMR